MKKWVRQVYLWTMSHLALLLLSDREPSTHDEMFKRLMTQPKVRCDKSP